MAEFATLADLRDHLNITRTDNDDELGDVLEAAADLVASYVGTFSPATVTERVAVTGGTLLLRRSPVRDVTVVDGQGSAVTGLVVNEAAGLVYDVPWSAGPLTVTYSVGSGLVPAAVRLATLIVAAHLWETQRGTSPSALALQQQDDTFGVAPGVGFALPNRAKELLQPYVRSGQVA